MKSVYNPLDHTALYFRVSNRSEVVKICRKHKCTLLKDKTIINTRAGKRYTGKYFTDTGLVILRWVK